MTTSLYLPIAAYLLLINGLAWMLFGLDKYKARRGYWRIPENTLLMVALVGGTAGAYAARHVFRHKTRKQPFSGLLHFIAVAQLCVGIGLAAKNI